MSKTALKPAAITRAAFDYQDLIGIEVLINFFRDPRRYQWVELESEDRSAGYLDDVVALRADGKFEYTQVKFTVDPDRYLLDWNWLLERKAHGTSRLKKWADSVSDLDRSGGLGHAELRTNRRPDTEFGEALRGDLIKLGKLSPSRRAEIERELGGVSEARTFFKAFQFRHSEVADVQGLEQRLKGTVVPTDTTTDGWLFFRQQVRRWATERKQPEPDGKIRHDHLVQIISKKRPRPIPQNFLVPDIYAVPSLDFHDRFLKRVTTGRSSVSILWGTPGRGKSTYLSFLINELSKRKLPCIRHHYFLSLDDTTTDRISFSDIAASMMAQIAARYPEAAGQSDLQDSPDTLRKWLEVCGEYFAKKNKKFYVVVDGLDHVWRERMNIDQLDHLFSYLLPCPKNVVLIVGTQRVADLQLPARLLTQAEPSAWIEIPPMDERAVHDWIKGQDKAKRLRVYQSLLDHLTRALRLDALVELFGLLKAEKHTAWRGWTEDALVRAFSVAGADLKTRIEARPMSASPLMGCYLIFQGGLNPPVSFSFDPTLVERERHEYGPNPGLQKFFHGLFFSALATYRTAAGDFSFVLPGVDETKLGWMKGAVDALHDIARDIADGRTEPNFVAVFERTHYLTPVAGRRTTEADSAQYWSFKFALRQISLDLHFVTSAHGQLVPASHFTAARATRHWQDETWLNENLENRFVLVEKEGAQGLLDSLYEKESRSITTFNERAERWIELALFALLYGLLDATRYVKRATDCLVGYGYHKDTYIYEVLDSIDLLKKADTPKALGLLKKVAPVVDQIMEMTDGDEVRGSRSELIDLIAALCPDKLPDCYAHHIRSDRLSLAEDALEAHCKRLGFDNEVELALARTFLERRDVLVLSAQKSAGAPGAADAFAEQERFLGGVAVSRDFERGGNSNDFARKGKPPDIRKFKPSQFVQLVDRVSSIGYEHRDETFARWIEYWKEQKKGREALKAVEVFFRNTERTYSAERILDSAFLVSLAVEGKREAYKWLVKAHSVRRGWQSYWSSSEETIKRLEWAATYYKDRWREFIRDSSMPEEFWEKRDYGFSLGLRHLVRFLILVDQKELAARYAATLAAILIEETADQPLPEIPWLR